MRASELLRRQARRGPGLWLTLAIAISAHAAALLLLTAPITQGMEGFGAPPPPPVAADDDALAPLDSTCAGDALLAFGARTTWSETPLDADEPFAAIVDRLHDDLAQCHQPTPVKVAFLDPAQVQRLQQIDPEPLLDTVTPEAQKQFEEKQQVQLQKLQDEVQQMAQKPPREAQVVETVKPDVEIVPDRARFVSEYNTKTERETVARGSYKEPMVQAPKPEELKIDPTVTKDPSMTKATPDRAAGADERAPDRPGPLSMRTPGALAPSDTAQEQRTRGDTAGERTPGDGATPMRGDGAVSQDRRDPSEMPRGQAGAGGGAPRVNLHPTDEVLQRVAGGGSVDHYDDVEDGELTAVNSRQWVGASFMNRAKRQVAQEWRPADVWRRFDPTGSVYGFKTRVTVLRVVLDGNGALVKTTIVKGSGADFLDDEAIRAFRAAGPFPNPPSVLRGDDGNISFNFGFYFEIDGGRESWKVFRAQ